MNEFLSEFKFTCVHPTPPLMRNALGKVRNRRLACVSPNTNLDRKWNLDTHTFRHHYYEQTQCLHGALVG